MKYVKTYEKFNLYQKLFGSEKVDDDNYEEENKKDTSSENEDIKFGEKSEKVRNLQTCLEELGFKLYSFGVDGIAKSETFGATSSLFSFLKSHKEFNDFVDDPSILEIKNKRITPEQQDLIKDLSQDGDLKSEISEHFKKLEKTLDGNIIGKKDILKHIDNPEEFLKKLNEIALKLHVNVNWLLLVMWKESKINPRSQNPISGASGLIQFMKSTAKRLGTSIQEIRGMSAIEQLDYVYKYFKPYVGKINSVQDMYLATFFPKAMGKSDDYILQSKDASAEEIANQNSVIDLNKDKEITKGEFKEYVLKGIPEQWRKEAETQV
jgi:hypothetical protein